MTRVEVIFGDSADLFRPGSKFFKTGKRPYQRLRAADLNRDGADDIVTTNIEGNSVSVLLADGRGGFNEANSSPFGCNSNPFGLAISDVNADGHLDLAIINSPGSMQREKAKME